MFFCVPLLLKERREKESESYKHSMTTSCERERYKDRGGDDGKEFIACGRDVVSLFPLFLFPSENQGCV